MRVLLSTIGSRGDVQPLVALALELRALGQEVRLCVPPDFREWIDGLGIPVTPIGPELRKLTAASPSSTPALLSPEVRRRMVEGTVATQFETITEAARGCDLIVGATALQIAAPSVAERMGVPYVFAAYCPAVLPSPHHPPIPLGTAGDTPAPETADNGELWDRDARRWNDTWGPVLNAHRASAGLAPVDDVRGHVLTGRPWLAADPALGPWPDPADEAVLQTGAWILPDERPLSPELGRSSTPASRPSTSASAACARPRSSAGRWSTRPARSAAAPSSPAAGRTSRQRTMGKTPCPSARSTSRRSSDGSRPSSTTAAREPPPRPRGPARPRSSSRGCTTSTTGRGASTISASAPRTPPATRPPIRWRALSSTPSRQRWLPARGPSPPRSAPTAPGPPPGA